MTRTRTAVVMMAVAAMSLLGCDQVNAPTAGPDSLTAPAQFTTSGNRWQLARGRTQPGSFDAKLIGREGGSLTAGGHTLEIRPGAVRTPTMFAMFVHPGEHIVVDLQAPSHRGAFPANTVFLWLSYRDADLSNSSRVAIGYLPLGTMGNSIVPLPVTAEGTLQVRTTLAHFSEYALILE